MRRIFTGLSVIGLAICFAQSAVAKERVMRMNITVTKTEGSCLDVAKKLAEDFGRDVHYGVFRFTGEVIKPAWDADLCRVTLHYVKDDRGTNDERKNFYSAYYGVGDGTRDGPWAFNHEIGDDISDNDSTSDAGMYQDENLENALATCKADIPAKLLDFKTHTGLEPWAATCTKYADFVSSVHLRVFAYGKPKMTLEHVAGKFSGELSEDDVATFADTYKEAGIDAIFAGKGYFKPQSSGDAGRSWLSVLYWTDKPKLVPQTSANFDGAGYRGARDLETCKAVQQRIASAFAADGYPLPYISCAHGKAFNENYYAVNFLLPLNLNAAIENSIANAFKPWKSVQACEADIPTVKSITHDRLGKDVISAYCTEGNATADMAVFVKR